MNPQRATFWTMRLPHGAEPYDRSAWRSIMDLERKASTPEGRAYLSLPRIYDMELGRPTSSRDPPSTNNLLEPLLGIEENENDELEAAVAEEAERAYGLTLAEARRKRIRNAILDSATNWLNPT